MKLNYIFYDFFILLALIFLPFKVHSKAQKPEHVTIILSGAIAGELEPCG